MKKLLVLVLLGIAFGSSASNTYTKEQLNSMDASGQYPDQEPPVTKSVTSVDFGPCKKATHDIYSQVLGSYPVKEIVNTNSLYVVKMWTNDAVIMVSCSEPDGKQVITQSNYK